MKALTIRQPWLWGITALDKRVENRNWLPPAAVIGQRIALHAGKTYDTDGHKSFVRISGRRPPLEELPSGVIVATAVVAGWIARDGGLNVRASAEGLELARAAAESKWFFGPVGWILEEVRVLHRPIPARGLPGVWGLRPKQEELVALAGWRLAGTELTGGGIDG